VKLSCPICQSKFSLDQAAHEGLMSEMVELASRFGKKWDIVYEYTDCFRVERWGTVSFKKRLRLLKEVLKLLEHNAFSYQGKRYKTDWARISAAITTIVNAEKFGLKNHNYLKKVMLGDAERVSDEGLTAREEQAREVKRRSGETGNRRTGKTGTARGMTGAEFRELHGIVGNLVDRIGSKEDGGEGGG